MDDSGKPESEGQGKAAKGRAEHNPWYLLATLYGVPEREKNRFVWNCYLAADLDEETRTKLIEESRRPADAFLAGGIAGG